MLNPIITDTTLSNKNNMGGDRVDERAAGSERKIKAARCPDAMQLLINSHIPISNVASNLVTDLEMTPHTKSNSTANTEVQITIC